MRLYSSKRKLIRNIHSLSFSLIDFFSSKEILYVMSHADAFLELELELELPVINVIIFSPIFFTFPRVLYGSIKPSN